ncbi:aminoglycoside phosphotransferase family protein [Halobacillus yeomjeoni]|uniref:phosphotransferase family protein n=1 Tax=Halobacillus yeomjeoni TaxID=311194 RepID=UPI001CD528B0|nr:aminoglycoside phosphotransferase family protein [Halobacillus yeomjeoni]MCA0984157.1 aminoglycoside phosphotransferase family protein [Halobacillus yeomjeoni]
MKVSEIRNRINRVFPSVKIQDLQKNPVGQNNDVYIADGDIVYRFPKYVEGVEKMRKEVRVLNHVKEKVSLSVPDPLYMNIHTEDVGRVFIGYPRIEGYPLWKESFDTIENKDVLKHLASQLGGFLKELHSTSADGLFTNQNEPLGCWMKQLYINIQNNLFPYMNEKAKARITSRFNRFIGYGVSIDSVLIHGDFGASNILWSSHNHQITGIIDFGETSYGDPAYDFAGLAASYGDEFTIKCLEHYFDDDRIFDRAKFYQSTFALQEALHGLRNKDDQAFENGMKDYL